MDTLEGGQEAEAGATVLLLPALLPALDQLSSLLCAHPRGHCQELRVTVLWPGDWAPMMGHGELTNTTAASSGSLDRGHLMRGGPQ